MPSREVEEEKPFLENAQVESRDTIERRSTPWLRLQSVHYVLFVANALFLAINVGFFTMNSNLHHYGPSSSDVHSEIQDPYSPAHDVIQYELRTLNLHPKNSPFVGLPRPELDEAWSDLLRPSMLDMPRKDMERMNKSSVAVQGTGGYVGYYEVFHQLHCLKRMYQLNYPESYPDVMNADRLTLPHWEHCIEVIRQGLMCKPDLTVNTVHWDHNAPSGMKGFTGHDRKCVNWDSFKTWVDAQALPAPLEDHVISEGNEGNYGP